MPGIASAATAVVIGHVAASTSSIRVGAGGIMLPNHAPLVIAEQFGTLATLFPGRIDLGLGRAPGTDPLTTRALRRNLDGDVDAFPRDVIELQPLLRGAGRRPARAGGAGSGSRRAALDTRIEPVRRAARGDARAALRVRVALRAAAADRGPGNLPGALRAVGALRATVRHGRAQRHCRQHGVGSAAPAHLRAAVDAQPASGPAGQAAAAGGGLRGTAVAGRAGRSSSSPSRARWSAHPTRFAPGWQRSSSARAPTRS